MTVIVRPQISNPDTLIAIAATGPIALDIAQPTEPGGATLTVTIDSVPGYGTVQYLSGANWTDVSAGNTLTPSQLASLRYVPPAGGEHSGGTLSYSVFDGTTSVAGTMNVSVVLDNNGPDNLYFSAIGPGNMGPDLFVLDSNGTVTAAPIRSDSSATFGSFAGADGGFVPLPATSISMALRRRPARCCSRSARPA
jgi:large repetitive protein